MTVPGGTVRSSLSFYKAGLLVVVETLVFVEDLIAGIVEVILVTVLVVKAVVEVEVIAAAK